MVTEGVQNIIFEKFLLPEEELSKSKEVVYKFAEKIKRFIEYKEIKIEMKIHKKSSYEDYEIRVHLYFDGGLITSEKQDKNPLKALTEVMKKVLVESEHRSKK